MATNCIMFSISSSGTSSSASESRPEEAAASAPSPQNTLPQLSHGVDRIIDSHDNEFVLSAPKDNVATLTLDPLLVQDLTLLFASAAVSAPQAVVGGVPASLLMLPGSCLSC